MSDVEMDEQPRRSGRQRKVPEAYGKNQARDDDQEEEDSDDLTEEESESDHSTIVVRPTNKKKKNPPAQKKNGKSPRRPRDRSDEDDDEGDERDDSNDDEDEDEDAALTRKKNQAKRGKKADQSGKKKKMAATGSGTKSKGKASGSKRSKGKSGKLVGDGDMEISDDNGLFNALMNPDTPILQVLEEWLINFQSTGGDDDEDREEEKRYLAELITFIWRCCGLSNEISPDAADDVDGAPDRIDDVHTELQEAKESPVYPLVSRAKNFKGIQKNLPDMLITFIDLLNNGPLLYVTDSSPPPATGPTTPLVSLLLTWLNPMTSSPYRAIRHTATFIAMSLGVGISKVAQKTKEIVSTAEKGRDQQAAKKGRAKATKGGKADGFEAQIKDGNRKLAILKDYLDVIFDGVFVHRYRDKDAAIRSDCLVMLGRFMAAYPQRFNSTTYLQYVDWALTDQDQHTRLEAVKILVPLYNKTDNMSSIRTFTTRVIPRIMEMAVRDISVPVRVEAIKVLISLDASGFLSDEDEEEREGLGCLLFDRDPKVRKAISGLLRNWYNERTEEVKAQVAEEQERNAPEGSAAKKNNIKKTPKRKPPKKRNVDEMDDVEGENDEPAEDEDEDEDGIEGTATDHADREERFIEMKVLASMLMGFSSRLERSSDPQDSQVSAPGTQTQTQQAQAQRDRQLLAALASVTTPLHTHATVAAETFWNTDLQSVHDWRSMIAFLAVDHSTSKDEGKLWALEPEQETFFLDFATVVVTKAVSGEKSKKKMNDEDDTTAADLSQELVDTLPKLFSKYQSDSSRMVEVLRLASHIDFQTYSELRLVPAYEAMWSDVSRQFLRHTDAVVLREVLVLMRKMMSTTSLEATNQEQFRQLKESLSTAVHETLADKDLAIDSFEDEDVQNIESGLLRVKTLMSQYNVESLFVAGDQDGEDFDLFDIIIALASRGQLGYRPEIKVVQYAMTILLLHLSWTMRDLTLESVVSDETVRVRVEKQRDAVARVYEQYAVSNETNAMEAVRREAISNLLRLHMLFRPISSHPADSKVAPARKVLSLAMDDAIQYRCAGAIQAAIERQTDIEHGDDSSSDASSDLTADDDAETAGDGKKQRGEKNGKNKPLTTETLVGSAHLQDLLWSFIHAMRARVIDAQHAGVMLSQYGRLDQSFDAAMPSLVEVLQEEGLYNNDSEMVTQVVAQALQQSFEVYLESPCDELPINTTELARLLSRAFFTHKAAFKVQRQLDASAISEFHQDGLSWALTKTSGFLRQEKASTVKKLKERFRGKAAGAIRYFGVLGILLPGVEGREALKIKHHLDTTLKDLDLKSTKNKSWDPLTHYEKRLMTVAASDNKVKAASKKQVQSREIIEDDSEDDEAVPVVEKPAPKRRNRDGAEVEAGSVDEVIGSDEPVDEDVLDEQEDEDTAGDNEEEAGAEGNNLPNAARAKRGRDDALDEQEEEEPQHESDAEGQVEDADAAVQVRPNKRTRRG